MNRETPSVLLDPKATTSHATGVALLHDPALNKGTAFTEEERDRLRLRGLLPPRVLRAGQQLEKVLESFRSKPSDLEKYIYLISLQDRNERLFYQLVLAHLSEMMPIIYTPTVGQACQRYAHLWRRPRGLFISADDRGRVAQVMRNWPSRAVRIIVVTDGERILGLGDLGANGMGIPVGKLSLYTACAGVHPDWCLPVTLDVGTENEQFLKDPLYIGLPRRRLRGEAYDALIDEFMEGARTVFPGALVQFEDFGNTNAFRILEKYRREAPCFNDDIQGTAAVTLAALWSALRMVPSHALGTANLLFLGAGEAGTGIGELVVSAMVREGVPEAEARRRCWFVDSKGLVVKSRTGLQEHKLPFAHDEAPLPDLLSAVRTLRPAALIGVSGQPQTFTREIVEAMSEVNERPIVFALSNPTSKSECTAEQAYTWSGGRAIFASGSPFAPVTCEGRTFVPGQANNAYIFPGVGLGAIVSGARRVTDEMFMGAARTLAGMVDERDLRQGCIFPPLERIREISAAIATAVALLAQEQGLATEPLPADVRGYVEALMYQPAYDR
ncbi:MAG TPA: NAD-dependent malic enzyme [Vicinamibacterales bacterium]|nr:NAD-dependent malic enzyme [Vicinamibacterales bacterium]